MKTWNKKVLISLGGKRKEYYTVKEASDKECTEQIAPIDHGLVNLYLNGKWAGFCGVNYAKERIVD